MKKVKTHNPPVPPITVEFTADEARALCNFMGNISEADIRQLIDGADVHTPAEEISDAVDDLFGIFSEAGYE